MDDDIEERPVCNILYRQSSIETRLSPVHLSDDGSSDDDSDDKVSTVPKVVDYKLKPGANDPDQANSLVDEKLCNSSNMKENNSKPNENRNELILNESIASKDIDINESVHRDSRDFSSSNSNNEEFSAGILKGKTGTCLISFFGVIYVQFKIIAA